MKRKKLFTRAFSASMALLVTMGFTACSNKANANANPNRNTKTVTDTQELASKFFKENPIDLSKLYNEDGLQVSVKSVKKINDRFYLIAEKREKEIVKKISLLEIDPSSGEQKLIEIEAPNSDVGMGTQEYLSATMGEDGKIYAIKRISEELDDATLNESNQIGLNQIETNLNDTEQIEADQVEVNQMELDQIETNQIEIDQIETDQIETNQVEADQNINIKSQSLCIWNPDGTFIDEVEIDKKDSDHNMVLDTIVPLKNGTMIMGYTMDEYESLWSIVDETGNVSDFKKMSDPLYATEFFLNDKGQVCCVGYDSNYTHMGIKIYDENMEVIEMKNFPDSLQYDGIYGGITFIEEDTVLFSGDGSLYTYHFGDAEAKEVVNYVNSNLPMQRMMNVFPVENDEFYASYTDAESGQICFGKFVKADPSEIVTKELIRIGGFRYAGNEDALKKKIVEFNAKNENYKLVYEDYSKYSTDDDLLGGLTQLNNDIISGNAPDIFLANSLTNYESLVSKGVFADIGEMMANDPEIAGKEYLENVFEAYKVDGKIYKLVPSFCVNTMIAKKSLIGDKTTFTMQDMKETLDKMGDDAKAFFGVDNESFLRYALLFNASELIDLKKGECSFDSQEFKDILEYAKTLPKAQGDSGNMVYDEEFMNDFAGQYRNNKTLLYDLSITSFNDIKFELNGYFGEPVCFTGFPSQSGKGACIYDMESYAISAKSKYKDVAWSFLREFLLEEYQNKIPYGLPVLKSAFDEKSNIALSDKMTYIDENGVEQEYEDTIEINGETVKIKGLSQEQLAELVSYIESIQVAEQLDETITDIVMEEVTPFFEGKKSAEEVAQIIQNRVGIWVKEQQ